MAAGPYCLFHNVLVEVVSEEVSLALDVGEGQLADLAALAVRSCGVPFQALKL